MIIVFDLDDTLYEEALFVQSGFSAVALHLEQSWGLEHDTTVNRLRELLRAQGRGSIFDKFLSENGLLTKERTRACLQVYRGHRPSLELFPDAQEVLSLLNAQGSLYLVTDGHKLVQERKVTALKLWTIFSKVMITHRYGRSSAKPSTYCFQRIKRWQGCDWSDIVYVGDNPAKDFVGLNPLGVLTVRVLRGHFAGVPANRTYDAAVTINDLSELPEILSLGTA